jgi:hypothetical protein
MKTYISLHILTICIADKYQFLHCAYLSLTTITTQEKYFSFCPKYFRERRTHKYHPVSTGHLSTAKLFSEVQQRCWQSHYFRQVKQTVANNIQTAYQ